MSKTIVLQLDDADYERLLQEAKRTGQPLEELAMQRVRLQAFPTGGNEGETVKATTAYVQALDGPNTDGEHSLQQYAHEQVALHGGTLEEHLARLRDCMSPNPEPSSTRAEGFAETEGMELLDANGWPLGFFDETYGSLAEDPLQRLPQGTLEMREKIQ